MMRATIKRGTTLQYDVTLVNAAGPVDLTSWSIFSQVRNAYGEVVGQVTATLLDQAAQPGKFCLRAKTADWLTGVHLWDIVTSYPDGAGGQIITATETVQLAVQEQVTVVPA